MRNRKMMIISVFVSIAIILSYVERLIPTPFLVAGAKLGLANIVTVMTLSLLDKKSSFLILCIRVVLVASLFSGFSGFLYSLTGGLLSFVGMAVLIKLDFDSVSLVGVSVVGSTLHSIGQLLVASLLYGNMMLVTYLPILLITGLITGIFVGAASMYLTDHLRKINVFS